MASVAPAQSLCTAGQVIEWETRVSGVANSPIVSNVVVIQPAVGGGVAAAQAVMLNAADTLDVRPNIVSLPSRCAFAVSLTSDQRRCPRGTTHCLALAGDHGRAWNNAPPRVAGERTGVALS